MELRDTYGYPVPSGDRALAVLAAQQHGVVATRQLEALGYSKRSVQRRAEAGRLHRLHRGVYAVGHTRISLRARWVAAVLACGEGALLSHHAAAALWELRGPPGGRIDVTTSGKHALKSIRSHVARRLDDQDRATIDAIPVTSLNRTLLDEAELIPYQRLRSMLEAAQRPGRLKVPELNALIARSPGRRGLTPLRRAIAQLHDEAPWLQSNLERRFLELIRETGLPEPRTNVFVEGELVDCYWPQYRLVIEDDSWDFHKTHQAFEADRRRDIKLQIAGYRVARITYERIEFEPGALMQDVRRLIGSSPR